MQDHVSGFLCAFSFLLSLVFLFSLQLLLLGGLLLFHMLGIILHFLHLGSVCYFLFLCVCYIQCSSSDFSVKIVFYCLALLCFIMFCIQYNTSLLCHMLSYSCVTSDNRMTHHQFTGIPHKPKFKKKYFFKSIFFILFLKASKFVSIHLVLYIP